MSNEALIINGLLAALVLWVLVAWWMEWVLDELLGNLEKDGDHDQVQPVDQSDTW